MLWYKLKCCGFSLKCCATSLQSCILYALYYGPCGLIRKDFSYQQAEVECPERVARKEEELMDLDLVINDIQNKLCI